MLEVHAPHESIHTWKSFFIHIVAIVIGLLIAVAIEQSVEALHRHHQSQAARAAIDSELQGNLKIGKQNQQRLVEQQSMLKKDLQVLESTAPDAEVIAALNYSSFVVKLQNAAWTAAKINGSLALIPPADVERASYLYEVLEAETPVAIGYFTDISSAAALVEHARSSGELSPAVRQQLLVLTTSALGRIGTMLLMLTGQMKAIEATHLEKE